MSKKLSKPIQNKLEELLSNVGDMALKRRARRIIEELNPQPSDKILDLGCGNGHYLHLLVNLPVQINLIGLDNDKVALTDAKFYLSSKGKKIKLISGDVTNIPFPDNTFDKVLMTEVIEHLPNDEKSVKEIFRVLKPNGLLVLTTTNQAYPFLWDPVNWVLEHLFKTHIKSGFWAGIWNQHLRLYYQDDLVRIIKKNKFNIELQEELTFWCLPFNHYLINFMATLVYNKHLPQDISDSLLKFKTNKRPFVIDIIYKIINIIDRLNDILSVNPGVSILVTAIKKS